jgi:pyruvate-formate lyase-activating enzyme
LEFSSVCKTIHAHYSQLDSLLNVSYHHVFAESYGSLNILTIVWFHGCSFDCEGCSMFERKIRMEWTQSVYIPIARMSVYSQDYLEPSSSRMQSLGCSHYRKLSHKATSNHHLCHHDPCPHYHYLFSRYREH